MRLFRLRHPSFLVLHSLHRAGPIGAQEITMTFPNLVGPWVDVRSFAPPETPRDGNAPWHAYIQAAVDYLIGLSIPQGPVGTLYFPPGRYRIDQPILISKVYNGVY